MKLKSTLAFIALLFSAFMVSETFAQSTFENVHALFQTKCTAGCHSGGSPSGNLNLSGTTADVYNRLVNVAPTNPVALAKGYKRVDPAYPYRSLLMKKVNHGLDPNNDLVTGEGNAMPNNQNPLASEEIELIRQWIIWGAPDTGVVADIQLIYDYYNVNGLPEVQAPPTPEEEGKEGFQVRFGPFFVEPGGEIEFFQKYDPEFTDGKEIIQINNKMSSESHHYFLFNMQSAPAASLGIEPLTGDNFLNQAYIHQYSVVLSAWPFSREVLLPEGTAFFTNSDDILINNLHIPNPNQDSILSANAYLNIYTQPMGSGAIEMHSMPISYGNSDPYILHIPPTGQPFTLEMEQVIPDSTYYFWTLMGHNHQIGTDFDIYKRNTDGSKGEQVYEGYYDVDYNFNQGYYSYSHPPIRKFDPFLEVDMAKGLIYESTWVNYGPDTVGFGFTTQDEMFVGYYQYTTQLPSAINEQTSAVSSIDVYPNPSRDNINLSYTLKNTAHAVVELFNITGSKVKTIINTVQSAGKHLLKIKSEDEELAPGTYMVSVTVDGEVTTKKIISLN